MAGKAARNVAIGVNGHDLSEYFRGMDSTWEIGLEDTTTFGATRTAKSWTLLLEESMLSLTGFWAQTAATVGVAAVIDAALAAAAKSVVTLWHLGDAVGAHGIAMEADAGSRKVEGAVDSVITLAAEFKSSVGEEDVICLRSSATDVTGDANGTTVDNGAASANGGAAFNEFFDGGTDMIVTIRHSDDDFVADDELLVTFATGTGSPTAQRVAIVGEIKRYTRAVFNHDGEDATLRTSISRNP